MIRALYDYEAQSNQELSFQKGDFFHVIGRENDTDWYEACNPALPDARGLVPVAFFQALGKTERDSGQSEKSPQAVRAPDHDSGYSDNSGSATMVGTDNSRSVKGMSKGSGTMVYGVVMYDFAAERPDELEAKAGEPIIVIAQSNPEWFVAKPIGRLGGPGLIPVSFIEIRDMGSGQAVADATEAVQRAGVPKVEEWKKMAADYKNSSIALGKFEVANSQQGMEQSMERMSLQQGQQQNGTVGFSSVLEYHVLTVHSSSNNRDNPNKHKPDLSSNNRTPSRTPMPPNPLPNYTLLSQPKYLDIVLQKTNTGLLSRRRWKMEGTGNCPDTTRTFTTFRLRF